MICTKHPQTSTSICGTCKKHKLNIIILQELQKENFVSNKKRFYITEIRKKLVDVGMGDIPGKDLVTSIQKLEKLKYVNILTGRKNDLIKKKGISLEELEEYRFEDKYCCIIQLN
jgi:hypothetical protein